MAGWIILGAVSALILLFLLSNVRLLFRYDNGEVFLQARWLFFRYQIMPEPEKRKKKKREKAKKEQKNHTPSQNNQGDHPSDSDGTEEKNAVHSAPKTPEEAGANGGKEKDVSRASDGESKTLQATIRQVLDMFQSAKWPIRLLCRHLWVRRLNFNLVVAREDAAQTAIAYGQMNGWVHGAYAALSQFVRMKKGRVSVQADYLSQKDRLQVSFLLTLRVLFLLAAAVGFLARFLWATIRRPSAG